MCELVLSMREEDDDRRVKLPHASIETAREMLSSVGCGWWPVGDRWPKAFRFDLWPGNPPLLVNGDQLKAVTVDLCKDYLPPT